ncbi:unnamed protein product [Caenorhabditis sp. 36 PRJEB53466]|nr:unnamed protein product [Caenorhabditis sp. 36 PRJEB53466]
MRNADVPSVAEILQTNQYLLVSQQNGYVSIERDVAPGKCPTFMHQPKSDYHKYPVKGVHLVRDPNGLLPPRILTIRGKMNILAISIRPLKASAIFEEIDPKIVSFVENGAPIRDLYSPHTSNGIPNMNALKYSLFDSNSHMLYLDYSSSQGFLMHQYYIKKVFSDQFYPMFLAEFKSYSPVSRSEWVEDQYTSKFYYKEIIDNEVVLFEVPMGTFIPVITDGESGTKTGLLYDQSPLQGASGGAFYTVKSNASEYSASLIPVSLGAGIKCKTSTKSKQLPSFNKLIIIRDNDYCMLRDGPNYNKKSCESEKKEYFAVIGEEPTDVIKWLLVSCIVMFMVIILLFVYIYWLRSTFESDRDRTHPHEFESEASLFVAKHRSFPSAYQDPALLDVSVDKWN